MEENNPNQGSILNVGDLAKPVDTLIQRASDFIGAALAPRQLVRMAKAKIEADRIEKLGNVETEIRERALQRLLAEEIRNQENIENIVRLSLPEVKEDAKPEEIEDDWLANFFDKSKRFSDKDMQMLWAKILAGEANKKGSFSRRTIEIVSTFDKWDAELFTNLCSFIWYLPDIYTLIFNNQDSIYKNKTINFDVLNHLESIGLIKSNHHSGSFQSIVFAVTELPPINEFSYFDVSVTVKLPKTENNSLIVGEVLFTEAGKELASICKAEKVDGFLEYTLEKWQGYDYKILSPSPIKI